MHDMPTCVLSGHYGDHDHDDGNGDGDGDHDHDDDEGEKDSSVYFLQNFLSIRALKQSASLPLFLPYSLHHHHRQYCDDDHHDHDHQNYHDL